VPSASPDIAERDLFLTIITHL